ncbi:MAG: hypothetical protein WCO42_06015, partial [bacterium]
AQDSTPRSNQGGRPEIRLKSLAVETLEAHIGGLRKSGQDFDRALKRVMIQALLTRDHPINGPRGVFHARGG